jgi:protein required for attachment to host cells
MDLFSEMTDVPNPDGRRSGRELGEERNASTHDRMGPARHSIEPHTTVEDKVAERFAAVLADVLEEGRIAHQYASLVLIAPPRFLGQLREALTPQVRHGVVADVAKDLCGATPEAIRAAVARA